MARKRSTGDLKHLIVFEQREEIDRGDGVTVASWVERYLCRAGFVHLRGGETVMADRLQGEHSQVIFVRDCSEAREVETDWRIRDLDTQLTFNVRDITQGEWTDDDRRWIDFLCQSGGVAG
ncbi:head-tail adaptor protein [Agrobacterium vitis]